MEKHGANISFSEREGAREGERGRLDTRNAEIESRARERESERESERETECKEIDREREPYINTYKHIKCGYMLPCVCVGSTKQIHQAQVE